MLFGPVFRYELSAVARRKRTFVVRGMYGLLLLVFFCIPLYGRDLAKAAELAHHELTALVEAFWSVIMAVQSLAVVILTPALVAGSLAQERAGGTMDLLQSSPLSSLEIVLGKLAARYVVVVMLIGLALPVFCILSLLGGVDVRLTILADAVLLATGWLIAATAIAASTLSIRPDRAITSTYLIVSGWMIVPALLRSARTFGTGLEAWLAHWAWPVEAALGLTNPMYVFSNRGADLRVIARDLILTMAAQVGLSLVLVAGSAAILRPLVRGAGPFGWRMPLLSFLLSRRRLLPRPRCGDQPMVWKECHVARTTVLFRLAAAVGVLAVAIPLGRLTWEAAVPAFAELQAQGYGSVGASSAREEFNVFLRVTLVSLYILMALGIAARSASSIPIEKEKGTWASLLVTPMGGGEIVGGKLIGAFWGLRWLGLLYLGYLALGLAAGSIHPLAGIYSVVLTAAFLVFTAALGITISMPSRSPVRARAATLLALFALNMLPMCWAAAPSPLPFIFASPIVLALGLPSFDEVDRFVQGAAPPPGSGAIGGAIGYVLVFSLVFHAASALALLGGCLARFESDADRPRRDQPMKRRIRRA